MGKLHARGLLEDLQPDDNRTRDGSVSDPALLEIYTALEMTRRTFTNACNIMKRHDFVGAWESWRHERGLRDLGLKSPLSADARTGMSGAARGLLSRVAHEARLTLGPELTWQETIWRVERGFAMAIFSAVLLRLLLG